MCGIFGIILHNSDEVPDQARLDETCRRLNHRGPDGRGTFAEPGVGLVHTRLSFLDLNERSNQPFWDRQRRFALVFNGEIYNFQHLRDQLAKCGVEFRTTSDTEVLLEALLKWGPETALPKLEGMFAFALYDRANKSIVLARDRFGIKPLFVSETKDAFVFASEIQAMRPWIKLDPDVLSISGFLYGFSGPTKGFTFFKSIRGVEPGGIIKLQKGGAGSSSKFFSLRDFIDEGEMENLKRLKPRALVDAVDERLKASVQSQLVADVPVGALCSGGLDSSIVMAIASRYHANIAIFHANVIGPVSEHDAALRLARHLKLDLKAVEIHDQDFIDLIPDVTEHFGHPFYSCPHSVPYWKLCQLVHQNDIKAVLSGEAADEYFLGYSFFSPEVRRYFRMRELLRLARRKLHPAAGGKEIPYQGPAYIGAGDANTMQGLVHAMHNRFEVLKETIEIRERLHSDCDSLKYRAAVPSLDSLGYNLRALLHRNDTMGMGASVECRFPFLESGLAKLAINMPYNSKIRFSPRALEDEAHYFFQSKWVLRQVGERYLPAELFKRQKRPLPINAYAGDRMTINPAYFENSFVAELFELGRTERSCLFDRAPHWLKFKLLLLEAWAQVCLRETPKEAVVSKLRDNIAITNPTYAHYLN